MVPILWFSTFNQTLKILQFIFFAIYRDRFRTAVNVLGDAYGAGIVEHLSRNDIVKVPEVEMEVPKEQRNGFHNAESGKDKMDTRMWMLFFYEILYPQIIDTSSWHRGCHLITTSLLHTPRKRLKGNSLCHPIGDFLQCSILCHFYGIFFIDFC